MDYQKRKLGRIPNSDDKTIEITKRDELKLRRSGWKEGEEIGMDIKKFLETSEFPKGTIGNLLDNEVGLYDSKKEENLKEKLNNFMDKNKSGDERWKAYFLLHWYLMKHFSLGNKDISINYMSMMKDFNASILPKNSLFSLCVEMIQFGKIFKCENNVLELLNNTSNKIFYRNVPFPIFLIDYHDEKIINGLEIYAIIVRDVDIVLSEKLDKDCGRGLNITVFAKDSRDKTDTWIRFNITKKGIYRGTIRRLEMLPKKEEDKIHKKIGIFICNFLDYLQHPQAKQTIYRFSNNNENRAKRMKLPLQDIIKVGATSELLRYISEQEQKKSIEFSYSFWVMGHFYHFRNKQKFNKLYSFDNDELKKRGYILREDKLQIERLISRWIKPYVKGKGILIDKKRIVQ